MMRRSIKFLSTSVFVICPQVYADILSDSIDQAKNVFLKKIPALTCHTNDNSEGSEKNPEQISDLKRMLSYLNQSPSSATSDHNLSLQLEEEHNPLKFCFSQAAHFLGVWHHSSSDDEDIKHKQLDDLLLGNEHKAVEQELCFLDCVELLDKISKKKVRLEEKDKELSYIVSDPSMREMIGNMGDQMYGRIKELGFLEHEADFFNANKRERSLESDNNNFSENVNHHHYTLHECDLMGRASVRSGRNSERINMKDSSPCWWSPSVSSLKVQHEKIDFGEIIGNSQKIHVSENGEATQQNQNLYRVLSIAEHAPGGRYMREMMLSVLGKNGLLGNSQTDDRKKIDFRHDGQLYLCESLGRRRSRLSGEGKLLRADQFVNMKNENRENIDGKKDNISNDFSERPCEPSDDALFQKFVRNWGGNWRDKEFLNPWRGASTDENNGVQNESQFVDKIILSVWSAIFQNSDSISNKYDNYDDTEDRNFYRNADLLLCVDQVIFCFFFRKALEIEHVRLAVEENKVRPKEPAMIYNFGMALMEFVPLELRKTVAQELVFLSRRPNTILISAHEHLVFTLRWQTGVQVTYVPHISMALFEEVGESGEEFDNDYGKDVGNSDKENEVFNHLFPKAPKYNVKKNINLAKIIVLRSVFFTLRQGRVYRHLLEKMEDSTIGDAFDKKEKVPQISLDFQNPPIIGDKAADYRSDFISFKNIAQNYDFALFIPPELIQCKLRDLYGMGMPILMPKPGFYMETLLKPMYAVWGQVHREYSFRLEDDGKEPVFILALPEAGKIEQGKLLRTSVGFSEVKNMKRYSSNGLDTDSDEIDLKFPTADEKPFFDGSVDSKAALKFFTNFGDWERFPEIVFYENVLSLLVLILKLKSSETGLEKLEKISKSMRNFAFEYSVDAVGAWKVAFGAVMDSDDVEDEETAGLENSETVSTLCSQSNLNELNTAILDFWSDEELGTGEREPIKSSLDLIKHADSRNRKNTIFDFVPKSLLSKTQKKEKRLRYFENNRIFEGFRAFFDTGTQISWSSCALAVGRGGR